MTTPLKTLLILGFILGIQAGGLFAQPSTWNPVITGLDHTLVISGNSQMMLDGEPLPLGVWIGAFFEKQDGSQQCAGMVQWQGANTVLPIYGANNNPPQGFATGEQLRFRLWSQRLQCELDSIPVSYKSGGVYTHQGNFASNGLSGLASLSATTGISIDLGSDTSICKGDSLQLQGGCCGTYLWSTADTSRFIDIQLPGSYWLQVSNTQGCIKRDTIEVDSTACGIDTISTAINIDQTNTTSFSEQVFRLYPNPASTVLHIASTSKAETFAQLMHADGQVISRWKFRESYQLFLSDYPSGFYVVILQNQEQHFVSKTILIKK